MCELRRLRRLKRKQQKIVDAFTSQNPLSILPAGYVSETGLTLSDITEKIEKLSECASIIELRDSFVQQGDSFEQVMKVAAANFCKQPVVCPVCADRMQARRRARFNDPIRKQAEAVENGQRYAYMITYTVKDGDSLSERMEHLKVGKKNFRKMGQRRGRDRRSRGEAAKIKAAISTVEIKRGKNSNGWHVHSHDLVFTDSPIDYQVYDQDKKRKLDQKYGRKIPAEKLRSAALQTVYFQGEQVPASKVSIEWFKATGGDSMSISIDKIRHIPKTATGKKKRMFQKMTFVESVAYQAKEVLKYPAKMPTELKDISDSLTILNETYNKRMTATYGEFRSVSGDDYNDNSDESESFVMLWNAGNYGEAFPGTVRDIEGPEATETRSNVGKALGKYRRRRKQLFESFKKQIPITLYTIKGKPYRKIVGDDLCDLLDNAKALFRSRVAAIWGAYRNTKNSQNDIENAKCDKYNPVLAAGGMFIPGSDRRDLYQMAFT